MSLPELSNEQKLTYIYQTLKTQEHRRKRRIVMNVLKWILLLSILYFAYAYRALIFERTFFYIQESVNQKIRTISEQQKAGILRGIQQILPPSLEDTLKEVQKTLLSGTGISSHE
jgi:hypothetical protein